MLTSTWFFLIFNSLLFTLLFCAFPSPPAFIIPLHYSRYPKLGSHLIWMSPHALGWGGRLQTPHASLTSQLSSAWSFHESTKLRPHPPHAEQRSKGTLACKSTSGEGQLQRMCNGKKIACARNMFHNKACRHFITQKYKMMWSMLPYRWILWTPKWCLRIILSYFAPDILQATLSAQQGGLFWKHGCLSGKEWEGNSGGCIHFTVLRSFANLCLESSVPTCFEHSVNYTENECHFVLQHISILI